MIPFGQKPKESSFLQSVWDSVVGSKTGPPSGKENGSRRPSGPQSGKEAGSHTPAKKMGMHQRKHQDEADSPAINMEIQRKHDKNQVPPELLRTAKKNMKKSTMSKR